MTKVELNKILRELLSNLKKGFEKNELAYLGLQSKYEGQIRDKIAWRLQCELDKNPEKGTYIVRREWPSLNDTKIIKYGNNPNLKPRNKVDLAVLKVNTNTKEVKEVVALIEFKAHMFLNNETWPYSEFFKDIKKMHDLTILFPKDKDKDKDKDWGNPHLYFVFLHGSPNKKCDDYASAVQYKDILNSKGKIKCTLYNKNNNTSFIKKMKDYWKPFFKSHFQFPLNGQPNLEFDQPKMNIPKPKPQYLGESFGYELYCAPMIWGPVKVNKLKNFSMKKKK